MDEKVFLIFSGANDRAIFALMRTFRECKAPFAVVARNTFDNVFRSAYASHVCAVRQNDQLTVELLSEWVGAARARFPMAELVLVPSSEYLNTFLVGIKSDFLREQLGCILPLVNAAAYAQLSNKMSSISYFDEYGVKAPQRLDFQAIENFPVVAKPFQNIGSDRVVRYPVIIADAVEMLDFSGRNDYEKYFFQEYVEGDSYYLLMYFSLDGNVFSSSQRNLGQQSGGKSIVMARTSSFHRNEICSRAIAALIASNFHGFAMIEFIASAQRVCFIEMNPRLWGPLQLSASHSCGIVEAFIGDYLHRDSHYYDVICRSKPSKARYLWLGGIFAEIRQGRMLKWRMTTGILRNVLSYLKSDVYLRRDSWRIFVGGFLR